MCVPNEIPGHPLVYMVSRFATSFALSLFVVVASAQGYIDVAPAQGVDHLVVAPPLVDFGCGVSFHDFDGDGWDDLTFGHMNDSLIFYRNDQGNLVRMPSFVFGAGETKQVLWADIDNDGDDDLLVTTFEGNVRLFRNDGSWTFTDITATAGFVPANGKRYGASFGDFDKDGYLDLYVCTYIYSSEPFAYAKLNHLYRNNGNGSFTDVTLQAGVGNGMLASFQSVWIDVDLDGWPDLYVINDLEGANALYRNNGDGTFTDVADASGLAQQGEHPMSISLSDFDLDGDIDIFATNTGVFPLVNNARSMLMVNQGDGTFVESSQEYGLDIFEWGWGAVWVDHDNSGYHDLFIPTHRELALPVPNLFYRNANGVAFEEALEELFPGPQIISGHCAARGDLNGDGYSDIVVQNQAPFPPNIWQNTGGGATWVRIGVEGTLSNRSAVGTWIKVYAGGRQHVHYTVCGENYISQSSQHVPFGLGSATVIDSVVVTYLSGHVDRYFDLAPNTHYKFTEGETYVVQVTADGPLIQCAPAQVTLDAGEHAGYLWSNGHTERYLTVSTSGTYTVRALSPLGIAIFSEPLTVVINPQPVIIAAELDPLCAGGSQGSIELMNLSGVPSDQVLWNTGGQGVSLSGLFAGVYTYLFTDVNGCTASGAVELMDPPELFVLVQTTPIDQGNDGSFSWTVFGGVAPYEATVDGVPVPGTSVAGLPSGVHLLLITDAQGCSIQENVFVSGTTFVDQFDALPPRVHPNPVSTLLHVEWAAQVYLWSITDATGRTVLAGTHEQYSGVVDVSGLRTGTYLLELHDKEGRSVRSRFVKH